QLSLHSLRPPDPSAPLFPYTTLFRSGEPHVDEVSIGKLFSAGYGHRWRNLYSLELIGQGRFADNTVIGYEPQPRLSLRHAGGFLGCGYHISESSCQALILIPSNVLILDACFLKQPTDVL